MLLSFQINTVTFDPFFSLQNIKTLVFAPSPIELDVTIDVNFPRILPAATIDS
jgi:hypothetical protein